MHAHKHLYGQVAFVSGICIPSSLSYAVNNVYHPLVKMDRVETPVILLSAVIVVINVATLFQINIEELTTGGFSIKPTDLRSHTECGKLRSKMQCTTSYGQNYINSLSDCGSYGSAHIHYTEKQCRRNENGDYCGVVLTSSSVSQVIIKNCTDHKTCTTGCAEVLRETLDFVGCCFSDSAFTGYFNSCGIPIPPPCPRSSLVIPPTTQDASCSMTEQFNRREYIAACESMPPVIQALNKEAECQFLVQDHNLSCSIRNNEYCMIQLQAFNKKNISAMMKAIHRAATHCTSEKTCSPQCKGSLSYIKDEIGCCINTFDAVTLNFRANYTTSIVNDDLWINCGIKRPKPCYSSSSLKMYSKYYAAILSILMTPFYIIFH